MITALNERTEAAARPQPQETGSALDYFHYRDAVPCDCDITFIVPCYNEADNIVGTLETIALAMEECPLRHEIIVMDDCSKDATVDLVQQYQNHNPQAPVRLIRNRKNLGLAKNFIEGAFLGKGRYYKLVCGDNVTPQVSLVKMCRRLGEAEIITAYHPTVENKSRFRLILSGTFTRIVNLLSGYRLKYYNGCGIFLRADVMRWHSRSSGFAFQAELIIRLLDEKASLLEIDVPAMDRTGGKSTALRIRNWISVGTCLTSILIRRLRRTFYAR